MSDGYRHASDHERGEKCKHCGALLGFTTTSDGTTVVICPGCGRAPSARGGQDE